MSFAFSVYLCSPNIYQTKKNMDYEELNYQVTSRERELEMSTVFATLMRKVYLWMTLALVITGFTAYAVASRNSLTELIYGNSNVMWVLIIVELALVIGISAAINKISLTVATLLFVLYSVVNGAVLSSIFFVYTAESIYVAFFVAAGTFAVTSLFGYFTKKDLSTWGRILMMALIGLIIASIVAIFVPSINPLLSYIGVAIFVGLTAYDTQKIKQMCLQAPDAGESMQKLALLGALSLYLDFINLFLYLLRIFGRRE